MSQGTASSLPRRNRQRRCFRSEPLLQLSAPSHRENRDGVFLLCVPEEDSGERGSTGIPRPFGSRGGVVVQVTRPPKIGEGGAALVSQTLNRSLDCAHARWARSRSARDERYDHRTEFAPLLSQ